MLISLSMAFHGRNINGVATIIHWRIFLSVCLDYISLTNFRISLVSIRTRWTKGNIYMKIIEHYGSLHYVKCQTLICQATSPGSLALSTGWQQGSLLQSLKSNLVFLDKKLQLLSYLLVHSLAATRILTVLYRCTWTKIYQWLLLTILHWYCLMTSIDH